MPLHQVAQLMVQTFDGFCLFVNLLFVAAVLRLHFISSQCKGPRAELASSPSVEGPINPAGPEEYTEQTLDAESQVNHYKYQG